MERCDGTGCDGLRTCSYPSVIRRVETGVPSQPILYEWVGLDDGDGAFGDDPERPGLCFEHPFVVDGPGAWLLFGHPDDESPESFEFESEGLEALHRMGPPCRPPPKPRCNRSIGPYSCRDTPEHTGLYHTAIVVTNGRPADERLVHWLTGSTIIVVNGSPSHDDRGRFGPAQHPVPR